MAISVCCGAFAFEAHTSSLLQQTTEQLCKLKKFSAGQQKFARVFGTGRVQENFVTLCRDSLSNSV